MARRDYSKAELDMLKTLEGEYLFGNLVNRYNAWAIANGYRERTASGLTYRIRKNLGSVRPLKYQPITAWGKELKVNRKIFSRAIAKDCLPYITYKKRKYVTESGMKDFISTNPSYFKNGDRDRIAEIFGEHLAKKIDKAPRITNNNACPIIKPSYRKTYRVSRREMEKIKKEGLSMFGRVLEKGLEYYFSKS